MSPITGPDEVLTSRDRAESFFRSYLALPVVLSFWIAGYLWKRTGWLRTEQIDVDTGRREQNWELIHAEREIYAKSNIFMKVVRTMF